jgi:MFS family permease
MNKKAGVPDGIFYLVAIFAVAIISIVGFLILSEIDDDFQASSGISDQGKVLIGDIRGKYVGIIDSAFLMIFIGVLIGTVVGVWFIRTHPALFWIMIPIFAFIIFLAAIYANVFWNFTQNDQIVSSASEFTIIPFILQNYAYVITGVVVLIVIALFAKGKAEQPI